MTVEACRQELERHGLFVGVEKYEKSMALLLVAKRVGSPGNHVAREVGNVEVAGVIVATDAPAVAIKILGERVEYAAGSWPSAGAYERTFATLGEACAEAIHYFFDADSPMSKEEGFEAGPGRVPGA